MPYGLGADNTHWSTRQRHGHWHTHCVWAGLRSVVVNNINPWLEGQRTPRRLNALRKRCETGDGLVYTDETWEKWKRIRPSKVAWKLDWVPGYPRRGSRASRVTGMERQAARVRFFQRQCLQIVGRMAWSHWKCVTYGKEGWQDTVNVL